MAWYKTGTVSLTNNSTTVTGSGTDFVSGAQRGFGFRGPNDLLYEITAVDSSTSLTITPAYGGSTASAQSYSIVPTQGLTAVLASDVTDLITDYQTVADNAGAGKFGDGSAASPGIRFVNDQDTGFFKDTPNEIAVSIGNTKVGEFTADGITFDKVTSSEDSTVNGLTVGRGAGDHGNNTCLGNGTLGDNTTGVNNTAMGKAALSSNTSGGSNSAYGINSLKYNTTGTFNSAFGVQCLEQTTAGSENSSFGYQTSQGNTTGSSNTAFGYQALLTSTAGSNNVAMGKFALKNATGSENVAIGRSALFTQTTGSGNFGAAFRNSSGAYAPVFNPTTHDNRVVMGHTGVTNAYVQVAWTVVSDARDKTEVESLDKGLDFVSQLNPVSYKFRKYRETEETNGKKRYGFLAQEVLEVEGEDNVIVDTEDLDKLKMTNEELIPVLVKAIQELKAEVETLKAQ
jgi:hypothetical protein